MAQGHRQQRYRVFDKIASGGMAEVFRAESAGIEGFKKTVAIKRVLPHLSKKEQFIKMFLDEARLSARLTHSNVVQVFDIGTGDNTYFIVMEYVDGADLKTIIENLRKKGQAFPIATAVYITTLVCQGLAYAHELADENGRPYGIVHRDMSPPNVLITKFGEVKIADFGLAKANTQLEHSEPGIIKGKFSYLSPEAASAQEVDSRTDIFAVGIILWEMLSGRRLFLGETDLGTVRLVQQARIPSLRQINPRVPPALERIILKALARERDQRYQTARELAQDLTSFLFNYGQPVGPWDVADLVRMTQEQKAREQAAAKATSRIDQIIQEALFEFTSLGDEDESSSGSGSGSTRSGPHGTVDWGAELAQGDGYDSGQKPPEKMSRKRAELMNTISGLELGNLAALEDEVEIREASTGEVPVQEPAPSQPQPSQPAQQAPTKAESKSIASTLILLVVVLLLIAAAVGGAYYAKLIHF